MRFGGVVSTKEWDEAHMDRRAVRHAYDAKDITHELYNSEQKSKRDRADMTVRFVIPTIADGHIFCRCSRPIGCLWPAQPRQSLSK
jgi:hypothetical protein